MPGQPLGSLSDSFGSAFTFDFGRNSSRPKWPLSRDMMGSWRLRSPESSPVEVNDSKAMDMRLQGQQEELSRMQQEQVKLKEELATQKVRFLFFFFWVGKATETSIYWLQAQGLVKLRTAVWKIEHLCLHREPLRTTGKLRNSTSLSSDI